MDTILVVNAGSSSVKFQVFGIDGRGAAAATDQGPDRRDRHAAAVALHKAHDKSSLVDQSTYERDKVPDVPAAIAVVATWLRETQSFNLIAVGHRVVHGGPKYDRPVADRPVRWSRTSSIRFARTAASAEQPRTDPRLVAAVDLNCLRSPASTRPFTAAIARLRTISRFRSASTPRASGDTVFTVCLTNTSPDACARWPRLWRPAA